MTDYGAVQQAANWEIVCADCGDITFCKKLEPRCPSCGSHKVTKTELRGEK